MVDRALSRIFCLGGGGGGGSRGARGKFVSGAKVLAAVPSISHPGSFISY